MKHIKGNAIDYMLDDPDNRVLLHVVNDKGVMGAGIAKEIKERIPDAYNAYRKWWILGCNSSDFNDNVVNMCCQQGYGRDGKRYLHYGYLAQCLQKVYDMVAISQVEYVIPYKMGCGLAGGDWDIVLELCTAILGEGNITIVELEG